MAIDLGWERRTEMPLPENEAQRLQALIDYDLDSTPYDEDFDRLTRIAERELGADVAAVTFVQEDEQWLKASVGTDHQKTDREESFCTYTILSDDVMIVEDTATDPRFDADHLVIDGETVRSYAGAPLVTRSGHRLGSLCVFSFEPSSFTEEDIELLCLLRDQAISLIETHHQEEKLNELAYYDSVTNLPNFSRFEDQFESILDNQRRSDGSLAVFHVTVPKVKQVSQNIGMDVADEFLKELSDRLVDRIGSSSTVTRIHDHEFLAVDPSVRSRDQAEKLAVRIRNALKEPVSLRSYQFLTSPQIGISLYPQTGNSIDKLRRQASEALRKTSNEDSDFHQVYLEDMPLNGRRQIDLESDFRLALRNRDLEVHYQPKVRLSDRSVMGAEALIRWEHPEMGFIPPPTIISVAERLGEVTSLGSLVLERAVTNFKLWNKGYNQDFQVGVNVSALEFMQGKKFINRLDVTLEKLDFPPELLELEVTETEIMEDLNSTVEILQELNDRGITVAIDDFGTGRSSLEYLAEFPEPTVKIDRAFIDGVTESDRLQSIVESVLTIANNLGLETVAEGVEREEEERYLKEHECDYYQGYYFSKPLHPDDFESTYLE